MHGIQPLHARSGRDLSPGCAVKKLLKRILPFQVYCFFNATLDKPKA